MKITIEISTIEDAIEAQIALAKMTGAGEPAKPKAAKPAPTKAAEPDTDGDDGDDDEDEPPAPPKKRAKRGGRRKKAAPKPEPEPDDEDEDGDEDGDEEETPPKKASSKKLASILDDDEDGDDEDDSQPLKSIEDLRSEAMRFDAKYGTEKLVELLEEKFGVGKLRDLKKNQYNAAYAAMLFYGNEKGSKKGKED